MVLKQAIDVEITQPIVGAIRLEGVALGRQARGTEQQENHNTDHAGWSEPSRHQIRHFQFCADS